MRNPHACRILARAWCRVIWACWQKGVAYDPAKHMRATGFAPRTTERKAA